jgi:hypothetical protein
LAESFDFIDSLIVASEFTVHDNSIKNRNIGAIFFI